MPRPPRLHHCTSIPYRFFGRVDQLATLDGALRAGEPSVVAFVGPGGQGKTAIVQHWLQTLDTGNPPDGIFLWSFYRGKDADLCLRELYAYAAGIDQALDMSASFCVDALLPLLRRERWALILDGIEVVQHDSGPWFGRLLHPELSRLIEDLASAAMPGVMVLTSRFPIPAVVSRQHARVCSLTSLDAASSRRLLRSLGVHGDEGDLEEAAGACGFHAKAVELLGTYLRHFHQGDASRHRDLPTFQGATGASDEERKVARVMAAFQASLSEEDQDILALATAFREPPTEGRLLDYLSGRTVQDLLHHTWGRIYLPFTARSPDWLRDRVQLLVDLRLLERVASRNENDSVIDAHPLVRRSFEHHLGVAGRRQSAQTRAGFLHGRPDRRRPATLEEAREEVEMFHAFCDAGLWNEADSSFVALENPKHRFLAPAFERDLLSRFFPDGDWHQTPLWPGFGRFRSLAISFEMLGQFEEALAAYRDSDAALRGDALIALGKLEPLLVESHALPPWQNLWQCYRAHALCLAGKVDEAVALARSLVPVDIYEWVHVFECLLRADALHAIDLSSILYRAPGSGESRWAELARQRMRLDCLRLSPAPPADLGSHYEKIVAEYDHAGLPYERALSRLGYARWLMRQADFTRARQINDETLELAQRYGMAVMQADGLELAIEVARGLGDGEEAFAQMAKQLSESLGHGFPSRS